MDIQTWLEDRENKSTLAGAARRMWKSGKGYDGFERYMRERYVLEALMDHDGNQQAAAAHIGICYLTIRRIVKGLGLDAKSLRELAKIVRSQQ